MDPATRISARARARRRQAVRRRRVSAGVAAAVAAIVVVVLLVSGGGRGRVAGAPPARVAVQAHSSDPFSYATSHEAEFTACATAGNAGVLFTKSPGGALATARRVARWRPEIDAAVKGTNLDPAILEGLVFVESAGDADAIVDGNPSDAAGLTQILPSTATSLLGMHVELSRSKALTKRIDALGEGSPRRLAALEAQRAKADERFDPRAALAATVRYLLDAERTFGREDLAFESYHMGIGNLQTVLHAYDGGRVVPYVQLYFDTGPHHHGAAFGLLSGFGDDSSLYWWRILGAVSIMHLYRTDPAALRREISEQLADPAGGTALHPPGSPARWSTPSQLSSAYRAGALEPLPRNAAQLGLAYQGSMGADAGAVSAPASLYRGLRPVARHELIALAGQIRSLSGQAPLRVAATVMDSAYQRATGADQPLAATGWQFDIQRDYRSGAQAQAFQELLDRLQSLDLIAWAPVGDVIEMTIASDAQSWRG